MLIGVVNVFSCSFQNTFNIYSLLKNRELHKTELLEIDILQTKISIFLWADLRNFRTCALYMLANILLTLCPTYSTVIKFSLAYLFQYSIREEEKEGN